MKPRNKTTKHVLNLPKIGLNIWSHSAAQHDWTRYRPKLVPDIDSIFGPFFGHSCCLLKNMFETHQLCLNTICEHIIAKTFCVFLCISSLGGFAMSGSSGESVLPSRTKPNSQKNKQNKTNRWKQNINKTSIVQGVACFSPRKIFDLSKILKSQSFFKTMCHWHASFCRAEMSIVTKPLFHCPFWPWNISPIFGQKYRNPRSNFSNGPAKRLQTTPETPSFTVDYSGKKKEHKD